MIKRLGKITNPAQLLKDCITHSFDQAPASDRANPSESLSNNFIQFEFDHTPDYTERSSPISLSCIWYSDNKRMVISITDQPLSSFSAPSLSGTSPALSHLQQLEKWISDHKLPHLDLSKPWPLRQLTIPKPWGAELWYTGIEKRGVCTANDIPLPWLLDCLPAQVSGSAHLSQPLLLKILAPRAHEALGDLYFELHDQKIEVYIVTHIDESAWPGGIGKIRYGFNQTKRADFANDDEFRTAYLNAVVEYQKCRNDIDELIDQMINQRNQNESAEHKTADVVSSDRSDWLAQVPQVLTKLELTLREQMNSFTHLKDIQVGDIIRVEPFFPHSLQHGVRVIEFQTASYERYILSFGQKVLTQNHWDTEQALKHAQLDAPTEQSLSTRTLSEGVTEEVIADFEAFNALRIRFMKGSQLVLPPFHDYQLLIGVSGDIHMGQQTVTSEVAFMIPANRAQLSLAAQTDSVIILAQPKSSPNFC